MALTGADYLLDDDYAYQEANEDKNHNRSATLPTNIQPGMLHSKSTDNQVRHCTVADTEGNILLQGNIICADNLVVCADNEVVFEGIT